LLINVDGDIVRPLVSLFQDVKPILFEVLMALCGHRKPFARRVKMSFK
jgi:hypothetical protein